MQKIALKLNSDAERIFFSILAGNARTSLKDYYMKISRDKTYHILRQLFDMQKKLGVELIEKQACLSTDTNLPCIVLERKSNISLDGDFVWFN